MSDLISTPSRTQSPVSSEAFEALIDLLASDGIDEKPSELSRDRARTQPTVTLRDSSGKLDFDKIRLMFAAQNASHRVSPAPEPPTEQENRVQSPAVPIEDGDSDEEDQSHQSPSSTVPSRSNSASPQLVKRATTGHRRSSTFGNQPWVPTHENATAAEAENVAPTLLRRPLSFNELNVALAGAQAEVRSLRHQYDELQALVSKRLGTEVREQIKRTGSGAVNTKQAASRKDDGRVETRNAASNALPSTIAPPLPSDVPIEIAALSEDGAKRALSTLTRSLNLSLSAIGTMAGPPIPAASAPQSLTSPILTRQHDIASLVRAVKFLGTVDELVWRRTSAPSGPRTLLPVFSEENIIALVARLELWERAVRRPSKA